MHAGALSTDLARRAAERGLVVSVVGASGLVGEVLLEVLAERSFPVGELRPLASAREPGRAVRFEGREVALEAVSAERLEGSDLVFFAATGALSRELAPRAVRAGAVVVDKSSTWRLDPAVPLVVPEVNPRALGPRPGLVACPNCTTIGLVMALEPLRRAAGLRRVVATTFQAVSGAGREGLAALAAPAEAGASGGPAPFAAPIRDNVVPLCELAGGDGYTTEEEKLRDETRKILGLPELDVTATCVRVPVAVGHGAAVLVETVEPLSVASATRALAGFPGVEVRADVPPTPRDVAGSDAVLVGRLRSAWGGRALWLWQVSDNLRRGAATNAVRIAELLLDPARPGTPLDPRG